MSRTFRLLEILIALQTETRFTVATMAEEFGVSRRTMLRDLHALSEMGVPLAATPGPGGGYSLIRNRRLLPLSLQPDEAIGMILSYEAFLQYAQSPFASQSLSAVIKLRNALPPDIVRELDRIHQRVVVLQQAPPYEAPFLADVLDAALDGAHLRIVYESLSRVSERVVYPYGLYASQGFWYCACHDFDRGADVAIRVDRIRSLQRQEGLEPRPSISVREWLDSRGQDTLEMVRLRAKVTPRGAKRFELSTVFGGIEIKNRTIEVDVPLSELDWFANQLLPLGTDIVVESPEELVQALKAKAAAIMDAYDHRYA